MNIHVITPFYRKHLLNTLIFYYEPMNIHWHPVCDSVDIEPFKNIQKEWIHPLLCKPLIKNPKEQCYRKINDFIDTGDIIDDDYYCFCGDDDMYEPLFFDNIRKQTAKILINSNYRGDTIPNDGGHPHETGPLVPKTLGNIVEGQIGFAMFTVKGCILKKTRFGTTRGGDDGKYAENLKHNWPTEIVFLTDWFVFGNFFQRGRHTKKEKFIKSNWELPVYIN